MHNHIIYIWIINFMSTWIWSDENEGSDFVNALCSIATSLETEYGDACRWSIGKKGDLVQLFSYKVILYVI